MHTPGSILTIILESILVGFGLLIPIVAFIRTPHYKAIGRKELFILTAVQMARIAGIIYFFQMILKAYFFHINKDMIIASIEATGKVFDERYFMFVWFKPLMVLLLTQLLWIKKFYQKKAILVSLALLLFLLPFVLPSMGRILEHFVILVSSFHRDYLPDSWSLSYGISAVELLLNIVLFASIVFAIILIKRRLNKKAS